MHHTYKGGEGRGVWQEEEERVDSDEEDVMGGELGGEWSSRS